jgi:hypothetical protein
MSQDKQSVHIHYLSIILNIPKPRSMDIRDILRHIEG